MHSKAYHRIHTSDAFILEGPVSVLFNQQGDITEWHQLKNEEPFTIWVGGILETSYDYQKIRSLEKKTV